MENFDTNLVSDLSEDIILYGVVYNSEKILKIKNNSLQLTILLALVGINNISICYELIDFIDTNAGIV